MRLVLSLGVAVVVSLLVASVLLFDSSRPSIVPPRSDIVPPGPERVAKDAVAQTPPRTPPQAVATSLPETSRPQPIEHAEPDTGRASAEAIAALEALLAKKGIDRPEQTRFLARDAEEVLRKLVTDDKELTLQNLSDAIGSLTDTLDPASSRVLNVGSLVLGEIIFDDAAASAMAHEEMLASDNPYTQMLMMNALAQQNSKPASIADSNLIAGLEYDLDSVARSADNAEVRRVAFGHMASSLNYSLIDESITYLLREGDLQASIGVMNDVLKVERWAASDQKSANVEVKSSKSQFVESLVSQGAQGLSQDEAYAVLTALKGMRAGREDVLRFRDELRARWGESESLQAVDNVISRHFPSN